MVLARDLTDKVGRILLGAGERLTTTMIRRLAKWSITEAEVIPTETSDSDAVAESERRESARLARISGIQDILPDGDGGPGARERSLGQQQNLAMEAINRAISRAFAVHAGNATMEYIAACAREVLLERVASQPAGEDKTSSSKPGPDR